MLPVGLTIPALLTSAGTVVAEFSDLIILVGGLSFGIFVVYFIINQVKRAKR